MNTADLFFNRTDLDSARTQQLVDDQLQGLDDGELFLEYRQSETLAFDDGKLKNASFNTTQGFGLRGVLDESTAYAHSCELSEAALKRAGETVRAVNHGQSPAATISDAAFGSNQSLYVSDNPLEAVAFAKKVSLLEEIDRYIRAKDERVVQVSASLSGSWQAVHIIRAGGDITGDIRPLVRLNISVVMAQGDRMESGSSGAGGRVLYADYMEPAAWQAQADEALRQAAVNLEAKPAPAGDLPVVLGPGWCGVLLHEAVGHGLEGDYTRKGSSTFAGRVGERVASPGVTIIDDGTIPHRRGSLNVDDEGTASGHNVLVEDGILKGYMHDRLNARLTGVKATGNGRRESFAHQPMPRMTNTYMENGAHSLDEMIASVDRGIYATHFGGGQVDITSGKFVFSASEAYLIEGGKVSHPVKGATLIGNGPDTMQKVTMLGADSCLDPGIGTCGKQGQSVPVGVGQPSMLVSSMTIGGTEA